MMAGEIVATMEEAEMARLFKHFLKNDKARTLMALNATQRALLVTSGMATQNEVDRAEADSRRGATWRRFSHRLSSTVGGQEELLFCMFFLGSFLFALTKTSWLNDGMRSIFSFVGLLVMLLSYAIGRREKNRNNN